MLKKFCALNVSLVLMIFCGYIALGEVEFKCPNEGDQSLWLENSEFGAINCQNLDSACAQLHQGNEAILSLIRSLNCTEDSLNESLLELNEVLVLSVLNEELAIRLLEREICVCKNNPSLIRAYVKIAKSDMFFREISCSTDLIIQLLYDAKFQGYASKMIKSEVSEPDEVHFRKRILDIYNLSLLNGVLSTKLPYLDKEHIEALLNEIYNAYYENADKTFEHISLMLSGDYKTPLRKTLKDDGIYKDYASSEVESYVHVCQAFRHTLYKTSIAESKRLSEQQDHETKTEKKREIVNLELRIINFCDDLINPSEHPVLSLLKYYVGPIVGSIIFFKTAKSFLRLKKRTETKNKNFEVHK